MAGGAFGGVEWSALVTEGDCSWNATFKQSNGECLTARRCGFATFEPHYQFLQQFDADLGQFYSPGVRERFA